MASNEGVLEISKSQANQWLKAMELCRRRVLDQTSDDVFGKAIFRTEVELHFFLVALLRFYRAVVLAESKLQSDPELRERLQRFHEYIGIKRTMRNVGEHFDEYLVGLGRDRTIDPRELQVWSMEVGEDNVRWEWLGDTFDLRRTTDESVNLWENFLEACSKHLNKNQ